MQGIGKEILTLRIDNINAISEFCALAMSCKGNTIVKRDNFIVDAKSIMGLYSIDVSQTFTLEIENDYTPKLIEKFKKWEVK